MFDRDLWAILKMLLTTDKIGQPTGAAKLELVEAATIFLSRIAEDCREIACRLGEDTTQFVIQSFDDRNPGSSVVLEFLSLQMSLHHPGGARTLDDGACWCEESVWFRQIGRIYLNVVDTTIKNKLRLCKAKGTKASSDFELKPELLNLAAEVRITLRFNL